MTSALKRPVFLIIFFYLISYFLSVVNQGVFFDDWVTFNHQGDDNILFFREIGYFLYWPGYFLKFAYSLGAFGVPFIRLTGFVCMGASTLILYDLLKRIQDTK